MLSRDEVEEIQSRYSYLINYATQDPTEPIDPLTYVDSNGDHLIHIAAQRGDAQTVRLLLMAGVDANLLGDMGSTPLHYARHGKFGEVVELLLANGALETIRNDFDKLPSDG